MTQPGACDNYSRGSWRSLLSRDCLLHTRTDIWARSCVTSITVARAGYPASVDVARRNVWHSLSQYVTQHPGYRPSTVPPSNRVTTSIFPLVGVRQSWPLMHAISVTNDLARTSPTNWMPRNYETRNNSAAREPLALVVGEGATKGQQYFVKIFSSRWY